MVSAQDVAGGTRVIPDDTVVSLEIEPDQRRIPEVVGLTMAGARDALLTGCFHDEVLPTWCVPEDFSGGEEALVADELLDDTGFGYDADSGRLESAALTPLDDWAVCTQLRAASTMYRSALSVPLELMVPLTTVPEASVTDVEHTLAALGHTADGCTLTM